MRDNRILRLSNFCYLLGSLQLAGGRVSQQSGQESNMEVVNSGFCCRTGPSLFFLNFLFRAASLVIETPKNIREHIAYRDTISKCSRDHIIKVRCTLITFMSFRFSPCDKRSMVLCCFVPRMSKTPASR